MFLAYFKHKNLILYNKFINQNQSENINIKSRQIRIMKRLEQNSKESKTSSKQIQQNNRENPKLNLANINSTKDSHRLNMFAINNPSKVSRIIDSQRLQSQVQKSREKNSSSNINFVTNQSNQKKHNQSSLNKHHLNYQITYNADNWKQNRSKQVRQANSQRKSRTSDLNNKVIQLLQKSFVREKELNNKKITFSPTLHMSGSFTQRQTIEKHQIYPSNTVIALSKNETLQNSVILKDIAESKSQIFQKIDQVAKKNIINRNNQTTSNVRDMFIPVEWEQGQKLQVWLGKMMQKVTSEGFNYFIKKELNYKEVKIFCCQNFLTNIIEVMVKHPSDKELYSKIDKNLMSIINHLCNKYPQMQQSQVNKKLKERVQSNVINHLQDDTYDFLGLMGFTFKYMDGVTYTSQISQFLNLLISSPFNTPDQQKGLSKSFSLIANSNDQSKFSPYKKFQLLMRSIFELVYKKDNGTDYADLIDETNEKNYIRQQKRSDNQKQQQEIEYEKNVRKYTSFVIGSKLSENTQQFSQDQINSGNLNIKAPEILRIIIKWIQELSKKLKQPQSFLGKGSRFKGKDPKQRKKINQAMTKKLIEQLKISQDMVQARKKNINQGIGKIGMQIAQYACENDIQIPQISFMQDTQKAVGNFAIKMSQAGKRFAVVLLSNLIHGLLGAVQRLQQDWLQNNQFHKQSFNFKNIQIDLLTFKIGDIMRCKCTSQERQILRIFDLLLMLSDESKILKIVRIKDRLSQGTSDILMNVLFDGKYLCQIQLAVVSNADQKQAYFDKFNHFLYEIRRSLFGPIMQMTNIIAYTDPKSKTFKKALLTQTKIKQKRQVDIQCVKSAQYMNFTPYLYSCICLACKKFVPYQTSAFPNLIDPTGKIFCGSCISVVKTFQEKLKFLLNEFCRKVKTFAGAIQRNNKDEVGCINLIQTAQQLKNENMLIMIPRNSKVINLYFIYKVTVDSQTILTTSRINCQGTQIIYDQKEKIVTQKDIQNTLKKYIIFKFNYQCIFIEADPNSSLTNQYVTSEMLTKIHRANSKIKVLYVKTTLAKTETLPEVTYQALFPYFFDGKYNMVDYFQKQTNYRQIKAAIKKRQETLDLNNEHLTTEFTMLTIDLKKKFYNTMKQLYLNYNNIQNIDFIQHMNELKILYANFNKIKRLPDFPQNIEEIQLAGNQFTKIRGFSQKNSKIFKLSLAKNDIKQIKNLETLISLQCFYLIDASVSELKGFQNNRSLTKISIQNTKIKIIQGIDHLDKLQAVYGNNTLFTDLTPLNHNKGLKSLFLSNCQLERIPDFPQLKQMEQMEFKSNRIAKIERLDYQFPKLIYISLSKNQIKVMQNLDKLQNLAYLHLSENLIEKIENLSSNRKIKNLFLNDNFITKIEGLSQLKELQILNLNNNQIEKVQGLNQNFGLLRLFLNHNKITKIQNIDHINSLKDLRVANNLLQAVLSLPANLKKVDFSNNLLKNFDFKSICYYTTFKLDGNQ